MPPAEEGVVDDDEPTQQRAGVGADAEDRWRDATRLDLPGEESDGSFLLEVEGESNGLFSLEVVVAGGGRSGGSDKGGGDVCWCRVVTHGVNGVGTDSGSATGVASAPTLSYVLHRALEFLRLRERNNWDPSSENKELLDWKTTY